LWCNNFFVILTTRWSSVGLRSPVLKIEFYSLAHAVCIYWQMIFIFGRKITWMVFFLVIEMGVSGSRPPVLKIDFYTFARIAFIYWQMYFMSGRKITCMYSSFGWSKGSVGSMSPVLKQKIFLYFCLYSLYLLTGVFRI
jgi:hypothetical protein